LNIHTTPTTRLTLRWLESPDRETAIAARNDLVDHLTEAGNSQEQIENWLNYIPEMTPLEGETLASILETEHIVMKAQGLVR